MASFRCYEDLSNRIPFCDKKISLHYPFGRLINDGIWEVNGFDGLTKNSSGDLLVKELDEEILGGFPCEIFQFLSCEKDFLLLIIGELIENYFPLEVRDLIHQSLIRKNACDKGQKNSNNWKIEEKLFSDSGDKSEFIAYLNSLHNIKADGANALAESQAMSQYFGELYEPFPLVDTILTLLSESDDYVVIVTGHAGDGKSTVALDLFKRLHGIQLSEPLPQPLIELERVEHPDQSGKFISIVKDMSELSNEQRLKWLIDSFEEKGSWLIVSNTGPLLNTLREYASVAPGDIESRILVLLNRPYAAGDLANHTLTEFPKKLVILNMTRLDNVTIGASLLMRMLNHSGWAECDGCEAMVACPLHLNRRALLDSGTLIEERVRWIYQRLTAYEQRLTLRQMVAHLAFSLTGGMSCQEAREAVSTSTAEGMERGLKGLESILFSEGFFGYRDGKPLLISTRLRAIELMRRYVFGAPVAPDFDHQLLSAEGMEWARLPETLAPLNQRWRMRAGEAAGARWRFAMRRLCYCFGVPQFDADSRSKIYFDTFLQSPYLIEFNRWQHAGNIDFSPIEKKRLCKICLRVLLEFYSGFSAGQFRPNQEYLYLTLRRPDRAVVQPTQLVVAELPFRDFDLGFDLLKCLPLLRFQQGKVSLPLTLPLLDFIHLRHEGQLGSDLSQIHLAQIEWFRAELLKHAGSQHGQNDVVMLRAGIDGQTHVHRYLLDSENQRLELEI